MGQNRSKKVTETEPLEKEEEEEVTSKGKGSSYSQSHLMQVFNHEFGENDDGEFEFGEKVREGTFHVGNIWSAKPEYVEEHKFTHVVHGMEESEIFHTGKYDSDVSELFLGEFKDTDNTNLIEWLPKIFQFLDDAFSKNEKSKVLVHCFAGSSRSSSIAAAYIMKTRKIGFEEVIKGMVMDRECIFPNRGFEAQLKLLQAYDYQVEDNEEIVKKGKILTDVRTSYSERNKLKEEIEEMLRKKNT